MAQRDPTKSKREKQALRNAPVSGGSARMAQGSLGLLAPKVEPARTAGLLAPSVPVANIKVGGQSAQADAFPSQGRAVSIADATGGPSTSKSGSPKPDIRQIELEDLNSPTDIASRIQSGERIRLSPSAISTLSDSELAGVLQRLDNFVEVESKALDKLNEKDRLDRAQLGAVAEQEERLRDEALTNAGLDAIGLLDPTVNSLGKLFRKLTPPALTFGLRLAQDHEKANSRSRFGMKLRDLVDEQNRQRQELQSAISGLISQRDAIRAEEERRKSLTDEMRPLPPGS